MGRLILHAGMHKTGSTSIQHSLQRSADALQDHGIALYPGFNGPNHSIVAFAAGGAGGDDRFLRRQARARGTTPDELLADCLQDFIAWLKSTSSAEIRVVSGEAFSLMPIGAEVRDLMGDVEVFMYTRSPVSYAVSMFQQRLHAGSTFDQVAAATFQESGSESTADSRTQTLLPWYRSRLESLAEVYGEGQVHVRSFESAQQRLIDDFGEWVFGPQVSLTSARINESLSNGPAHLLEALNRLTAEEPNREKRERLQTQAAAFVRGLSSADRFAPPAFDWERFQELVKPDCAWLEEFSGGEIVYDDVEPPESNTSRGFDWLAESLMSLLRERAESRLQKQVYRRLFLHSVGRERPGPPLARFLRSTTDEQFLHTAAHNFRAIGHDDAKLFQDVAQQLADNSD